MKHFQSWKELDSSALQSNVRIFKDLIGHNRKLMIVVKSNAYGHGSLPVSKIVTECGADWLGVFTVDEALELRKNAIQCPILVFGPVPEDALKVASENNISVTIASLHSISIVEKLQVSGLKIHLKLETGTNRQGFQENEIPTLVQFLGKCDGIEVEGAYTHFADIEDTTDHSFAELQLNRYKEFIALLDKHSVSPEILHTACTAATLLFEDTFFNMSRVGIGTYGLWPSRETFVSVHQYNKPSVDLQPVMSWKTVITQIKKLEPDEYVGYGRTFRTSRKTNLAIIPVGYANGYPRSLSGRSYVLVCGKRAPLVGRVMMNMSLIDVTDIPEAKPGDEVVLLGKQLGESVTAENIATWIDTINYEIVTRAEPNGKVIVK